MTIPSRTQTPLTSAQNKPTSEQRRSKQKHDPRRTGHTNASADRRHTESHSHSSWSNNDLGPLVKATRKRLSSHPPLRDTADKRMSRHDQETDATASQVRSLTCFVSRDSTIAKRRQGAHANRGRHEGWLHGQRTDSNFFDDTAWPALHERFLSLLCGRLETSPQTLQLRCRVFAVLLSLQRNQRFHRLSWHHVAHFTDTSRREEAPGYIHKDESPRRVCDKRQLDCNVFFE